MVTSVVGRIFLNAYNERYGTSYDARSFFTDVFYPLFFGHSKYMIWVTNSPFVQGFRAENWTESEGRERLKVFIEKVESGSRDASVAVGYAASDVKEYQSTSGQVTDMDFVIPAEEVYFSWFGFALGVCVSGGCNILFYKSNILMDIFDGWQYYRKVLDSNDSMNGHQCNTFNGQWLIHKYSHCYVSDSPMSNFSPLGKDNSIETVGWIQLLSGISNVFREENLMGYLYKLGNTNETYGFLPFLLGEIRRPKDLYKRYFGTGYETALALYGTANELLLYCEEGVIGVKAMEPEVLPKNFKKDGSLIPCKGDEKRTVLYRTYLIWIIAMLNNQTYWDKSLEFAKNLNAYVLCDDKALSTKRTNEVGSILKSKSKKTFIEALTPVVKESENKGFFIDIAREINGMASDNVPYFLSLLNFQYASI